MPTKSAILGFTLPINDDRPTLPEALKNYAKDIETYLANVATQTALAVKLANDYDSNGYRRRGAIPVGSDVETLDVGMWSLSSAWSNNRELTNMPTDPRADAPGNMEVLPFASGLKMLRWTTAAFSSSATPYSWVKFQSYAKWGPWKEITPSIPINSVAGLQGDISATELVNAILSYLEAPINEAVSKASIKAAEGDLNVFDTRYVRGDNLSNQAGGPGTLAVAKAPNARNNTAYGVRALPNLAKGRYNDFFGLEAGYSLNGEGFSESEGKASRNAGFGANTQRFNKTGSLNVSMGRNTLQSNETGTHNTVVGADSAGGIAHMRLSDGQIENQVPQNFWGNSTLGTAALSRTQGNQHVAVGAYTLHHHKVGTGNVGVGFGALRNIGTNAGYTGKNLVDTSANSTYKGLSYSIANERCTITMNPGHSLNPGYLLEVLIAGYETQFWYVVEASSSTVVLNVGMPGFTKTGTLDILNYSTTVTAPETTHTIGLGFQAGQLMDNGSPATAVVNAVAIGANSTFIGDNTISLGNSEQTVHTYKAVQTRSDLRDKSEIEPLPYGLDFINELEPVQYRLNPRNGKPADNDLHAGFIAQDVQEVAQRYPFGGVQDNGGTLSIAYSEIIPALVKSVQELTAQVEELTNRLNS